VLDAIYFPVGKPGSGQEFSRDLGEGTFALRRAESLELTIATLVDEARRYFDETATDHR